MKRKWRNSGIQRKYMKYMAVILAMAMLLSMICVWVYVKKTMTSVIVDKYAFMNEKMGLSMDDFYRKTDEVTAECILNDGVQKSLGTRGLEETEKTALSKYFSYIDLGHVAEYCYVDNKKNVYTKSYSKISYGDFAESGFADKLGEDYAKTQWFWAKDSLFGKENEALFIGRYVRSMNYSHEPGMLFFKMNADVFVDLVETRGEAEKELAVGVTDAEGTIRMNWCPENVFLPQQVSDEVVALAKGSGSGMILRGKRLTEGILSAYRQEDSGMIIFTYVPEWVLTQGLGQVFLVMIGIYFLVAVTALMASIYLSKILTRPIQVINEAMTGFDGNDFSHTIELHTNTELDQIGQSYNQMLERIQLLLQEVRQQQEELRTSELNMLISQINPHFIYNTLDTIYMLARINGEETTKRMISALSSYLRLSLSKGRDLVTIEDELDNVKSYMEIQQIRNENLFVYEILPEVETKNRWVLKLILQPLVENSIKYGFRDIFEGGIIRIRVWEETGRLSFAVYNNGTPMERETAEKLNALGRLPVSEMKNVFPNQQQGYGVINIITRLRLKYGEGVEFAYEVEEEGTTCLIRLPVEKTKQS